jgi:hypothetical protein
MAKGELYEYAVLRHPKQTKEQAERNETPKTVVVVPQTSVLAANEAEVSILAGRAIPPDLLDKLDEIQICVRPF